MLRELTSYDFIREGQVNYACEKVAASEGEQGAQGLGGQSQKR